MFRSNRNSEPTPEFPEQYRADVITGLARTMLEFARRGSNYLIIDPHLGQRDPGGNHIYMRNLSRNEMPALDFLERYAQPKERRFRSYSQRLLEALVASPPRDGGLFDIHLVSLWATRGIGITEISIKPVVKGASNRGQALYLPASQLRLNPEFTKSLSARLDLHEPEPLPRWKSLLPNGRRERDDYERNATLDKILGRLATMEVLEISPLTGDGRVSMYYSSEARYAGPGKKFVIYPVGLRTVPVMAENF